MIVDPASTPQRDVYKLLIGSVVPRPIGFVSTVSTEGVFNLAPFSFFNAVCGDPPMVCFAISHRDPSKDTARNVAATREFVVNIVSEEIAEKMNLTSGDYAQGVDEFAVAGLTPVASEAVRAPRVAESPVSMECRVVQMIDLSPKPAGTDLVIGEVVRFHVKDEIVENFRIDPDKLKAIARMGGNEYSRSRDRFELIRPKV
ncbi:MAG: flavin reductase family protein [Acidobacteriia bacterium]|nr:flavin reductase family protein [Terriglobia bacterium]